jgi:hypothetical protein
MGKRFLPFVLIVLFFSYNSNSALSQQESGSANAKSIEQGRDSVDLLSGISAKIKSETIYINWRITNPVEIAYFDVQRLDPAGKDYVTLNKNKRVKKDDYYEKSKDGNGLRVLKYDYEDEPDRDGVYFYRIRAFGGNDNLLFISEEIKIGVTGLRNFKLEQNHPNPFNPVTSISYTLYSDSYVKLRVFDLIGKEIATLVDKNQTAGTYTVDFDASRFSNLTSGIYFYKIETEKYSEVKKMILTK